MKAANQDDWKRITLRLPPELMDGLKRTPKREKRSINAHIVYLIEESLKGELAGIGREPQRAAEDVITYVARETEERLIERVKALTEKEQEALLLLLKK